MAEFVGLPAVGIGGCGGAFGFHGGDGEDWREFCEPEGGEVEVEILGHGWHIERITGDGIMMVRLSL